MHYRRKFKGEGTKEIHKKSATTNISDFRVFSDIV